MSLSTKVFWIERVGQVHASSHGGKLFRDRAVAEQYLTRFNEAIRSNYIVVAGSFRQNKNDSVRLRRFK